MQRQLLEGALAHVSESEKQHQPFEPSIPKRDQVHSVNHHHHRSPKKNKIRPRKVSSKEYQLIQDPAIRHTWFQPEVQSKNKTNSKTKSAPGHKPETSKAKVQSNDPAPADFTLENNPGPGIPRSSPIVQEKKHRALGNSTIESTSSIPHLMDTWNIPREQVMEFIRLSVLPSNWTICSPAVEEWEAQETTHVLASGARERHQTGQATKPDSPAHAFPSRFATNNRSPVKQIHRKKVTQPTTVLPHRSHGPQAKVAESMKISTPEQRLEKLLNDFRSDPIQRKQFQAKMRAVLIERKVQHSHFIEKNMVCAALATKAQVSIEREAKKHERHERQVLTRHKKAQLLKAQHRERVKMIARRDRTDVLLKQTRCQMWLPILLSYGALIRWFEQFQVQKNKRAVEALFQTRYNAATRIQRKWKTFKTQEGLHQNQIVLHYLVQRLRCVARCNRRWTFANRIRNFLVLAGAQHESSAGSFKFGMYTWRYRVIQAQRVGKSFGICTQARCHALSLLWDKVDQRRVRKERRSSVTSIGDISSLKRRSSISRPDSIVRIPKRIKRSLIRQYIVKKRRAHLHRMSDLRQRSSGHRRMSTADALASLENASAWKSILSDAVDKPPGPAFQLYYNQSDPQFIQKLIAEAIRLVNDEEMQKKSQHH